MYFRLLAALPLFVVLNWGCAAKDARPVVVDAPSVAPAADASQRRTIVLDVRDTSAYAAGHVRDAVRVDAAEWKQASFDEANGIENAAAWGERIGALGIRNGDRVVIYDGGKMLDAARIWFILQHFGVEDATVVNGGWPALQEEARQKRIATSTVETRPEARRFIPRGAAGSPPAESRGFWEDDETAPGVALASREELRQQLGGEWQILDTRTEVEYRGEQAHQNPRGGHLPGARNIPHAEFLTADGRLKSPEELATLFERAGFEKGRPIVAHCESGGRASLAALAAVRAGYGPVLNYYRSFSEWSKDEVCPVERH